jgi:predicted Rossmann-fold nucleotide-binding protein
MAAGIEGAGPAQSLGVNIRLPFEQEASDLIAGDPKLVSMKYFFTRKLMLIKESRAFVCLAGGFGTLDETFELLTLTQTGKGLPVPIVFLDMRGDTYWGAVKELIEQQLVPRGLVTPADVGLFLVTDDAEVATREILGFYANYDSLRYVGDELIIRLRRAPNDAQLADLNERFGQLAVRGRIERSEPLSIELRERDALDLKRIRFTFARHGFAELRALIDALNDLGAPG